ncbi:MAG: tRNA uridine-5-carboxymethylaminomethyl(34) synthesis GTPase MnmE [Rhodoblastus sp.]
MADSDTIFALATPPGRSALAVFRISGKDAGLVLERLTGGACPSPRLASLRFVYDPSSSEKIDQALVTFFAGPASYTGEDLVELSVHGGRGVVVALSAALGRMRNVRMAEPGEFTRRAFANGKFDLAQAEAIADLIDSETEFQRRQALRLLDGGLGLKAEGWSRRILAMAAELESALDFSDEGDVGAVNTAQLIQAAELLSSEMNGEVERGTRSLSLRNGFAVVIAGSPNAGKSTLFNLLAGSDLAIVTEFAGTTRDLLRVELDFDGVPVTLVDSAGIRDVDDPVEKIGIGRARSAMATADLIVSLESGDAPRLSVGDAGPAVLNVWSKSDLYGTGQASELSISATDSDSISRLVARIRELAMTAVGDGSEGLVTRERHRMALGEAGLALKRFVAVCGDGRLELAAEECRYANVCLGGISGAFATEDILGEIFSRFCIGK